MYTTLNQPVLRLYHSVALQELAEQTVLRQFTLTLSRLQYLLAQRTQARQFGQARHQLTELVVVLLVVRRAVNEQR